MDRRNASIVIELGTLADDAAFDIVILGAGAAGLTAAVFAGLRGARALVVERTGYIGGTSATTAGTLWLPGVFPTDERSAEEDVVLAGEYLQHVIGADSSAPLRERFLAGGAGVIDELTRRTRVRFARRSHHPDYLGDVAGAAIAGRAIEAVDFDGRVLGRDLRFIRPPLRDFTIFGGLAPSREELKRYTVIATRPLSPAAWRNAIGAAPRVARHAIDLVLRRRTSRLTLGNALIGRLMASLQDLGTARIVLNATASEIRPRSEGIEFVTVVEEHSRVVRRIRPRRAVVSATGGFTRGAARGALLPDVPLDWSAVARGADASAHPLLASAGATFKRQGTNAFWAPVSLVPAREGAARIYPHFALDRGKPGFLIVDAAGRRFTNEANPYHVVGEAMLESGDRRPSFLIVGHSALRRYGLGAVKPGGWGLRGRLRDGYITRGTSIEDLGRRLAMPPGSLAATIARFNEFAVSGVDEDFGRGSSPYQRALGDPAHAPNPSLGEIGSGPYYALRIYPGDIGAASGFAADERARALGADGEPIPGLYVLGSDMRSIMGGRYPGPGITLGPAVVFAALAVEDALGRTS